MNNKIKRILFSLNKKLILADRRKIGFLFLSIIIFNMLAAALEGASFATILMAFKFFGEATTGDIDTLPFLRDFLRTVAPQAGFVIFALFSIALQILRSAFAYFGQAISSQITTTVQTNAQKCVYAQILRFSFPFVSHYKVGDLVEYTKSPQITITATIDALNKILVSFFTIITSTVVMFILSPGLSLLAFIIFGLSGILLKFIIKKVATLACKLSDQIVELSMQIVQSLYGLRVIFTFNRQNTLLNSIESNLEKLAYYTKRNSLWINAINPVNEITGVVLVGLFLVFGQFFSSALREASTPSLLLTFIIIVYRLNTRIQILMTSLGSLAEQWGRILRLEEILSDENKEFASCEGQLVPAMSDINFFNVSLDYRVNAGPSLKNLSFSLPTGAMVALVGGSGSGKSSIVDLILGLYKPSEGDIFIGNENLKDLDINRWRDLLGVVSQETFIFNTTIEENIRFGKQDASSEEIEQAAQLSGAHEFIIRLPDGYKTILGERGYRLSGGERQRLALARALIRDPQLLILDEATSNLDSRSEELIQKAMEHFRGQKTILVVAHRLSTIARADVIYVLEKGEIVERGTHNDLLSTNGSYSKYWTIQTAGFHAFKINSVTV